MPVDARLQIGVLQNAQRVLWDELAQLPTQFVLYDDTAIALRLGHRQSGDFDFFCFADIATDQLLRELPLLADAQVLQRSPSTLTVVLDRGEPAQLSFFGQPHLRAIQAPEYAPDNGVALASLTDLGGMKAEELQARAEAKDYLDIDALLTRTSLTLPVLLAAARAIFGSAFNPQISLKALSYFGDVANLPHAVQVRLANAARAVDLAAPPADPLLNERVRIDR